MIKTNHHAQWIRQLVVLIGIVGISPLVSLPALAQIDSTQPAKDSAPYSSAAPSGVSPKVIAQGTSTQSKNLVQLAQQTGSFTALLQAGQAAGLLDTLASKGPYTVFAPNDGAVAALPQGVVAAALRPENKELLRQVLLYHVVPGRVTSSQLKTGTVKTLGGGVAVRVAGGKVIVNNASVIQPNVQASNGVAHVINRVLIPENIQEKYASQLTAK
jgi:uncharacterized surface protein with fasciclin (FAS1) repeats